MRLQLYLDNVVLHQQRAENIPAWLFDSIADIGYMVHGKAWASQFIADYQTQLLPDLREGWVTLALARIQFYEGNYADSIALLSNNSYFHEQGYFYGKPFILYAYYETNNYDAFFGLLDSLKHTLKRHRHQLSPLRKEALQNTLQVLPQLYRLRIRFDSALRNALYNELQNRNKAFHAREWLLQKIADIGA